MIRLSDLQTPLFSLEHLHIDEDVSRFVIEENKGAGLEQYLKEWAKDDELSGLSRTYVIKDKETNDLVAYFTLRTGLITVSRGWLRGFDAHTGIELANFAVNDAYRSVNDVIPKLGSYLFDKFILPLVTEISQYVGAEFLYIYALPEEALLKHYQTMGFQRIPGKMERFVYRHVKPAYDKDCIFMLQKI